MNKNIVIGLVVLVVLCVAVQGYAMAAPEPSNEPASACGSCCGGDCGSCCSDGACSNQGTGTTSCGC